MDLNFNVTSVETQCIISTVKFCYNGLGYNRYSVNTDFFLVLAESLLI